MTNLRENLKFDTEAIRYISIFESLTGAAVKDCIFDDERKIIMVVKKGQMGLAIGKKGRNINKVKKIMKRDIEIVEYSPDPHEFVENLLRPIRVKNIQIVNVNGKTCARIQVMPKDKGIAIGRNGKNIKKIKQLVHRNHGIDNVIIK